MILFLIFLSSFSLNCQILDCKSNLKVVSADRNLYGVQDGKIVELQKISRDINKVSVIVPVYREWKNGNLRRLLINLGQQTLPQNILHVVLVVNNSPEVASHQDSIFRENQAALAWLGKHRRNFAFSIDVLDLSTEGVERNMGMLRQVGAEAAYDKSLRANEQLMVFMDADTQFKPDHLSRLRNIYQKFEVDVVLSRYRFVVRDTGDLRTFLSFPNYHSGLRYSQFRRAINYAQDGAGTPQISVLAETFRKVGGFPLIKHSEDFELMRRLAKAKTFYAPDLFVNTEDRARLDGFDASWRSRYNETYDWSKPSPTTAGLMFYELLSRLKHAVDIKVSRKLLSPYQATLKLQRQMERVLNLSLPPAVSPDYFSHHEDEGAPNFDQLAMSALFKYLFEYRTGSPAALAYYSLENLTDRQTAEDFRRKLDGRTSNHNQAVLSRHKLLATWLRGEPLECHSTDAFIQLFCAKDSALRNLFSNFKRQYGGEADALKNLPLLFPNWLAPWEQSRHIQENVMFELAEELILTGLHDLDKVPGVLRIFQ